MMKKQLGFTMIEIIVVIIALAIIGTTIMFPIMRTLFNAPDVETINRAVSLGQERMEMIIAQRHMKGFSSYADPCPGPSFCTPPSGYTITSSIVTNWQSNTNFNQITVTVSGEGDAVLQTLVANY